MKQRFSFPRMRDLQPEHLLWDLHIHSNYVDGKNSTAEMIAAAQSKGLQLIAFTEHVRTSFGHWWESYVREIQATRSDSPKVLIGFEANAIGPAGNVDVTPEMWRDAEIRMAAVHGYYDDTTWNIVSPKTLSAEQALAYEIRKLHGLCQNEQIDILAHPFWLYRKFFGEPPAAAIEQIAREAARSGTAYEINSHYRGDWPMTCDILRAENPPISLGSNAHDCESVGLVQLEGLFS